MVRKKPNEDLPPTDQDATRKLVDVLQLLTKEVERLNQHVGTLAEQSQALTAAIDDVRQEIEISCSYYLHFLHLLTGLGSIAKLARRFWAWESIDRSTDILQFLGYIPRYGHPCP